VREEHTIKGSQGEGRTHKQGVTDSHCEWRRIFTLHVSKEGKETVHPYNIRTAAIQVTAAHQNSRQQSAGLFLQAVRYRCPHSDSSRQRFSGADLKAEGF
jgi:hypothetical protein